MFLVFPPGYRNTPASLMLVNIIVYNCKIGARQPDQVRGNQYRGLLVTGDRCHSRLSTNFKIYHYQFSGGSRGLAMSRSSGHTSPWLMVTLHSGNEAGVIKTRAQDFCALCEFFLNLEIWSNLDLFGNWILLQHSFFLFLALLDTLLCLRFINSSFILPTKPKCSCLQILKCINVNVVVKWHIFHRNCTNALKMFPHIFPQCSVTECHCTSAGDRQVPQSSPQLRQSVWRLEHEYSPRQTSYWTVTLCYCDIYADIYHLLSSSQSTEFLEKNNLFFF